MERNLITVGFHKGEIDFGVSGEVQELSLEKMNELRAMLMVAIGIAENQWSKSQSLKPENMASRNPLPPLD